MMDYIDVAIVTWPNHPSRWEYFHKTMDAMFANLSASRHWLRFNCSAETEKDPRSKWFGPELEAYCVQKEISLQWRDKLPNLGGNMNDAMAMCDGPLIYVQQDDWRLKYPLDLSDGADFMLAHPAVDLLRYSWPDTDRMRPTFIDQPDGWRRIDMRGRWPYGDDPHLRHREFMSKWAWYFAAGPHASASSRLMAQLRKGQADIRVADRCYYQHFGQTSSYPRETRQGRKRYK